ncbi:cytochrome c biogenesis protein transmembrane region [Ferrimonas balearica DSM 9799]|uniref:Thiol:disulfide interchange protein DsbD n=1 Tax=Ferrimonas balearica (strain DSM 9799 / CCM 4581 / KCTC 23876 / PAT) TaxID=550540 RepID=E1SP45_FERBD|nr:protein-disulfide reductase DsbD [Ferrimonas balearica]ADN74694.1 cytochrome c biogenesis protein transmembrane region [Ferrimonas balearica DSM 9799]
MTKTLTRLLLLPLLGLLSLGASANFSFLKQEPQVLPVDQAYLFDFRQQDNALQLTWTMAGDQYYLYQDKFVLKVEVDGSAELGPIQYPSPVIHTDEFFGDQPVYFNDVTLTIPVLEAQGEAAVTVTYQGCLDKVLCYPPTKQTVYLSAVAANDGLLTTAAPAPAAPQTQQDGLAALLAGDGLLLPLVTFFGLGILLAFTPCVFPMYPILTGIIAGQGKKLSTGKAFALSMTYVQGMALTYSLLGLVVASAGVKYQAALQSPAVLIGLAILFVVLSLSMFGLYNLQLPSSLQGKLANAQNQQKGGSFIGVFVMGLISGLVASPCTTAPLSGALIYVAQSGDLVLGGLALYALSMGMGLPLLLLGTSGGKLLPKAGAWMEAIKHVFGFLLIAVSIMMLDRLWPGTIMDVIWALWGVALAGYLLHQNKKTAFSWMQTVRNVVVVLGLFASVSYGFHAVMNRGETLASAQHAVQFIKVKTVQDLEREVAKAGAEGKTVMLDLYADWCVACKEFEHKTFPQPQVTARTDKMVLLQADVTANDAQDIELLESYQVLGLPTLLFFTPEGEELNQLRVTGFMGPNPFADHLDAVLAQ